MKGQKHHSGRRRTEHTFSQVPKATIPRSSFNRSHTHKTTFDAGLLIPIYVDEALPGDTFNLNMTAFTRLATPIFPIMDNLTLDIFFFFIPNRLVWTNWQKFCGEQKNPGDSTDFTIPQVDGGVAGFSEMETFDYMGIPPKKPNLKVSALPPRSYILVWNEWFRDQNLQNSVAEQSDDGPDVQGQFSLQRRGKRHDYFTSCLPSPQKGVGVELPIGGFADVVKDDPTSKIGIQYDVSATPTQSFLGNQPVVVDIIGASGDVDTLEWGADVGLKADMSTGTAVTINAMREAFQLQKLLERDARGGTRYTEVIRAHFQVTSPDQRLQRPEYLGGGSIPIIVNAISQTTQKAPAGWQQTEKGSLTAYATGQSTGIGFTKSFVEHGTILGLASARADLTYQQGTQRMWKRTTRFDFYWPSLATIGEQAVLNEEIFTQGPDVVSGPDTVDSLVFGYQERWAEYRYNPSRISGLFRSEHALSLDSWHLAQEFSPLPTLGSSFITENPPLNRVIAVITEPHFIFDSFFSIKCARPMPLYSVPGLIDHF